MKPPNAFTFGHKKSYDESLRTEPEVTKLGYCDKPKDFYPGGACWKTLIEAEAWLNARDRKFDFGKGPVECDVYGLILPHGWKQDVNLEDPNPLGFHHLLNDARIVPKDFQG
jgi:hypothetical protein